MSISPPPLCSVFGPLFVAFSFFSESCDFVKVELTSGPELDFEGAGLLKMLLFLFWPLPNFFHRFVGSQVGGVGGGTPWDNLSALGGALPMCTMLIGTGTRVRFKTTTPAGGLDAKLGAVGKQFEVHEKLKT